MKLPASLITLLPAFAVVHHVAGDRTILYQNDFEHPKKWPHTVEITEAYVDSTPVNDLYGGQGGTPFMTTMIEYAMHEDDKAQPTAHGTGKFGQEHTVETALFQSPTRSKYYVVSSIGGMTQDQSDYNQFGIAMLSTLEDDKLWLDFTAPQDETYFTLEMDISGFFSEGQSAHVDQSSAPSFKTTLKDMDNGAMIKEHTVTGIPFDGENSLAWSHVSVAFEKGSATNLRIMWDLLVPAYAVLDNLLIYTDTQPPPNAEVVQPDRKYFQQGMKLRGGD